MPRTSASAKSLGAGSSSSRPAARLLTLFFAGVLAMQLLGDEAWVPLLDSANLALHEAGKDLGELSPGAKLPLPPGTHQLELSSARHFYKDTRAVSVTAGQTTTLTSPGLATLTVNTYPGSGKVFVDGVDTGTESDGSSPIRLATGRHTITVRGPKGARTEVVDLTGDKLLSFQL